MTLFHSNLSQLKLLFRGKVRDVYDLGSELLIVTTDRLSAFDVVLPNPIPGKGKVLTALSNFWFEKLNGIIPNHLTHKPVASVIRLRQKTLPSRGGDEWSGDPKHWQRRVGGYGDSAKKPRGLAAGSFIANHEEVASIQDQAVIVRKTDPLKIEAVARGYLAGSGFKDYQKTGMICGIKLPKGLREAERLPNPIFTPATKAERGAHDENISFDRAVQVVGGEIAEQVREMSLHLYQEAVKWAEPRGIILADTKFEFGLLDGKLIWIDEALTPDSSRFWPKDSYQVGISPPSFDKQFVRDYLESIHWNKKPPAPSLPNDIIQKTSERYQEALRRLSC